MIGGRTCGAWKPPRLFCRRDHSGGGVHCLHLELGAGHILSAQSSDGALSPHPPAGDGCLQPAPLGRSRQWQLLCRKGPCPWIVPEILAPRTLPLGGHQCVVSFPLEGSTHSNVALGTLAIWCFPASSSSCPDHKPVPLRRLSPPGMPVASEPIPPCVLIRRPAGPSTPKGRGL